jgi:hypothetical protein
MSFIPRTTAEYINYAQAHGPVFVANAAAIGVLPATATAFSNAADALTKTYNAQVAAAEAAKAATATLEDAIRNNRRQFADIVRMVRVKAAAAADPTVVYNAANIPAPAAPTPVAAPGTPRDFTVNINTSNGAVTVYMVQRKFSQTGAPQFCGLAGGEKTFTDATLPVGTDSVIYMVTGQRSGVQGQTAEVNVRFGTVGGNATVSIFNTPGSAATKMAA